MNNAVELLDTGFAYLVEKLGIVDAERFFDYTIWRREYFDKIDLTQINTEAAAYARKHPHTGKGIRA